MYIFKSRKFWAAVIGLAFVFVAEYVPNFPFSQDQVTNFVYVIMTYIGAVALEDGLSKR